MKEVTKEVLWYGKNEPLPSEKQLHAGSVELTYQEGNLRNIRVGDYEVLRMVYFALRDHNWGTIVPKIRNEVVDVKDSGFKITYESHFDSQEIRFTFQVSISGSKNGQIVFDISGVADNEFRTNRIGFCVLHPIKECLGKECEVVDPNGEKHFLKFPELISPHQPMQNISEISWQFSKSGNARVKFHGDVFEMEDQRNWTDDSFKTYCRPLELPFPFKLKKGDEVRQRIEISIQSKAKPKIDLRRSYRLTYDRSIKFVLPEIGIGKTSLTNELRQKDFDSIGKIDFQYYAVDVAFNPEWQLTLEEAIKESDGLGLPLYLKVHFSENYLMEIEQLSKTLLRDRVRIHSILILEADETVVSEELISIVLMLLKTIFPNVKIGAGTTGFFAELNRNRIEHSQLDFLSFSINPQVHAFDNLTLIENLNGQGATVETAKLFAKKEIHVCPVTFKMQSNPAATSSIHVNSTGLSNQIDPRQMSLFGAAWTLGSIKHLVVSGAAGITYFETIGEKGIIQGESNPHCPDQFHAQAGAVFPLYYVLKEVLKHVDSSILASNSSHPLEFEGLVFDRGEAKTFLLVNFTNRHLEVQIDDISPNAKIKKLDEKSVLRAMYDHHSYENSMFCEFKFQEPITTIKMRPFAFVVIEESP